ncbi:MAG TPA: ABC transporter ATP-binding protein [Candidatus Paceibacterota bacterium]|jgi:NitT/TauT family transport system ATP-binding protein|nr:ABC transporter ATP-binding protein [Candidatus Paceibacterota bacterium]
MPVIEFRNIAKLYPGETRPALKDVSFSIAQGEFVCIIGPSGCGKTTVLKLIAGLEEPTAGEIKKPQKVAMSFQLGALFPWLTVFENAALGLRQKGASESEVGRVVERNLRAMNMHAYQSKYPSDLSGGQRQRVGIARALAVDPEVLLLDEPFSALDPKTTAELHDDIIAIWRATKKTIVMVSHVIEEAVSLADRVILMQSGTVDSVFPIELSYPRRESENFHRDVMRIRREFFR